MRMRTIDVALLSVVVLVVAGSTIVALRHSESAVAAEPAVVMSAAEERDYRLWQETQACIRARHASVPPAGMTEETFCQAYAMVQMICRSQGKHGGFCE